MCIYIHATTVEVGAHAPCRVYAPTSTVLQSGARRSYPIRVHDVIYIIPTHTYIYMSVYIRYICLYISMSIWM